MPYFSFVWSGRCVICLLLLISTVALAEEDTGLLPGAESDSQGHAARRLVLCLDGTSDSAFDKTPVGDGTFVLKPTNVLKLCRSVMPRDIHGTNQINYYLTGVGSVSRFPGASNALYSYMDRFLGGIWGAGFEANIQQALSFLIMNYRTGDEVYIFGFSRGAATARGVTRFLAWSGGMPHKEDSYYMPIMFREFIRQRGGGDVQTWIDKVNADRALHAPRQEPLRPFRQIPVTYLGVWDTVTALGSRFQPTGVGNATAEQNFFVAARPSKVVLHARQALAIDERRFDFRPEVWHGPLPGQTLEQRWFPGVHSNVGGGYLHDGLANGAFRWLLEGARVHGLTVEQAFVDHYRPYPQDSLYDSYSLGIAIVDALRFRLGDGVRHLTGYPAGANLGVDASAFERMASDPAATYPDGDLRYPRMEGKLYRPRNLLQYLACVDDVEAVLSAAQAPGQELVLPDDVRQALNELASHCPNGGGNG